MKVLKNISEELCIILPTGRCIIRVIKVLRGTCANLVFSVNSFPHSQLDTVMSSAKNVQDGIESSFSLYHQFCKAIIKKKVKTSWTKKKLLFNTNIFLNEKCHFEKIPF